jgi:hypothetical protein
MPVIIPCSKNPIWWPGFCPVGGSSARASLLISTIEVVVEGEVRMVLKELEVGDGSEIYEGRGTVNISLVKRLDADMLGGYVRGAAGPTVSCQLLFEERNKGRGYLPKSSGEIWLTSEK